MSAAQEMNMVVFVGWVKERQRHRPTTHTPTDDHPMALHSRFARGGSSSLRSLTHPTSEVHYSRSVPIQVCSWWVIVAALLDPPYFRGALLTQDSIMRNYPTITTRGPWLLLISFRVREL